MSTIANGPQGYTIASSSNPNDSSDLNFTSSDSNDAVVLPQGSQSPSKSSFQWPSEPLNRGRPSLPQESQKSVDDANRDISDRITTADQGATSQPLQYSSFPGLDHPRLSAQLTTTLNNLEDDRRGQLSPTSQSVFPDSASALPMLSPVPQNMQRVSSNGTNKSAGSTGSDKAEPPSTSTQFPSLLPDMFRNAATMQVNLLRSLVPDNAFSATHDEGLSASTLQVPVTSFNALFEACKALEWLATQASSFEGNDRSLAASRRASTGQQASEDSVDFTYFDYFQLLQKVADVVSGLAASRGIDVVLDLDPQLEGEPAENQRHYKLGSCTIWADRVSMTFLFTSCISRLIQSAPVNSSIVITSSLTKKEETVVRPDNHAEMKLIVLSLGLRLILPRTIAVTSDLMTGLSDTPASLLLDAFGARVTIEDSTGKVPGSPDRAVIDHSISIPVGQLAQDDQQDQHEQQKAASKHIIGPNHDELVDFVETLHGKKVALYSTSQSIFARQLAKFLTDLGCEIAPVFSDSADESSFDGNDQVFGKQAHTAVALTSGRPTLVSYTSDIDRRVHPIPNETTESIEAKEDGRSPDSADTAVLDPVTGVPVTFNNDSHQTVAASGAAPGSPKPDGVKRDTPTETQIDPSGRRVVPFSFVIIDDDIVTLQKELLRIRSAVPLLKSALSSKSSAPGASSDESKAPRPTLDHRTKSCPQVNRLMASQPEASHSRSFGSLGTVMMKGPKKENNENGEAEPLVDESVSQTVIFFTSMKSYKLVRDTVQPIIDSASFRGVSSPPEIMVLPKPASAKRILTALHSAQHKPIVKLPFLPIATSPLSPLTMQAKTWWTPDSSQKQDGEGIMTLTRRQTASTDADFDTTPSTPWTPVDAIKPSEALSTPQIPLTSENLPLAGEPSTAQGASVRTTRTQETAREAARGVAGSAAGTTTKSIPRSTGPSRPLGRHVSSSAVPVAAAADATSTQLSTHAGSAAPSSSSPPSSILQARSHAVSSPMPAEALEYFSETAAKMGGSAASGLVIQSPDGRPAGIFFQPKATPSLPGSKPALSRGVSASSLRRSSQHTPSEQGDRPGHSSGSGGSDAASRDRRSADRSGSDASQARAALLPTVSEQNASTDSTTEASGSRAPPLRAPTTNKYTSGNMFAPQVGIHSVLNSARPPISTPLLERRREDRVDHLASVSLHSSPCPSARTGMAVGEMKPDSPLAQGRS